MTLVFLDTETTSLRHDRRAWDIALIRRDDEGNEEEQQWFIDPYNLDLGNADLFSLKIGHFYERFPEGKAGTFDEFDVLTKVEKATRGAHIVGAVPNFDTEVIGNRMREHGICPSWHYHLIDVETLTIGYLRGRYYYEDEELLPDGWPFTPPWDSEKVSRAIGIGPPDENERHTALGDARWVMRQYDRIMSLTRR